MSKFAWVTLTTNDTYSLGALVLANSLKRAHTAHQLAVLVTPGVSDAMRSKLKDAFNVVQEVDILDSKDSANLALLARPELGITFTKLHCWRLVQFEKCVFLDADTVVLKNCDELFEREEFSAAPDVSWPDCFNSGVFVFRPSVDTFGKITDFAVKHGSFDGGDQGLLNLFFSDWAHKDISKHLPFTYNTAALASYCYLPAFKQFRDQIKIVHFCGKLKPWFVPFNTQSQKAEVPSDYTHATDIIQMWWTIFCESVHDKLSDQMLPETFEIPKKDEVGLAGALSSLKLGERDRTPEQEAYEHLMRRQLWETGNIDYCGKDSFDNIMKRITKTLEEKPTKPEVEGEGEEATKKSDDALTKQSSLTRTTNFLRYCKNSLTPRIIVNSCREKLKSRSN
ncbi:GYG1.2 family protein [Megaselia abdita]